MVNQGTLVSAYDDNNFISDHISITPCLSVLRVAGNVGKPICKRGAILLHLWGFLFYKQNMCTGTGGHV
jgi:hypothetical protein